MVTVYAFRFTATGRIFEAIEMQASGSSYRKLGHHHSRGIADCKEERRPGWVILPSRTPLGLRIAAGGLHMFSGKMGSMSSREEEKVITAARESGRVESRTSDIPVFYATNRER